MTRNKLMWLMCGILSMSIEVRSEWVITREYTVGITGITTSSMIQVTTSGQIDVTTGSYTKLNK